MRRSICIGLAWLMLAPAEVARALEPAYLEGWPTAERVLADHKGNDRPDTLARQMAALHQLALAIDELAGPRRWREGLTADEQRLKGQYVAAAESLDKTALDNVRLGTSELGAAASKISRFEKVRAALRQYQREFAGQPGGAVLDGRDIGTRICPDADVKIYVTASPQVRAQRRTNELLAKGRRDEFERILSEIRHRDARDSGRAVAPLMRPAATRSRSASSAVVAAARVQPSRRSIPRAATSR